MLSEAPVRRLPFAEFKPARFCREGQAEIWRACDLDAKTHGHLVPWPHAVRSARRGGERAHLALLRRLHGMSLIIH
jgi:hypothetical protein